MTTYRKSIRMLLQLAVLYMLVACVSVFAPDRFLLRMPATLCLMGLSLGLLMYFSERVIDRGMRRCLVAIAGMLCFWFILRGAKYVAFEESETVARHIWYFYYLPILTIPLLTLFAALCVGRGVPKRQRLWMAAAALATAALFALVLSNDRHQLFFVFKPGFADWDADYRHGRLFPLIYLWVALPVLAAFWILLRRCRLSASRRLFWIPLIPTAFGVLYIVLYALDSWPRVNGGYFGEFPESMGFMIAGVWLSLIRIGLVPSNEGYAALFEASDLSAQIADASRRVVYRSAGAARLTPEQLAATDTVMLDADTRLHRKAVRGGWVYWQDDVSRLRAVNAGLEDAQERLAEEAELLRLENELKQERARIEARLRVYDGISAAVLPQSARIEALCVQAQRAPERFAESMKTVCLLGAYIKRYANLSLLAADRDTLASDELYLAVAESVRQLENMRLPALAVPGEKTELPASRAAEVYARFEALLEQALPELRGLYAVFTPDELKLTLEGAALAPAPERGLSCRVEDGGSFVRLALREEGEP